MPSTGCESLYVRTLHVNETLNGVTPWHGLMMVFELVGHPEAECCYAWNSRHDGRSETHVVLQVPPVTTPASALQAAYEAKTGQQESPAQVGAFERENGA